MAGVPRILEVVSCDPEDSEVYSIRIRPWVIAVVPDEHKDEFAETLIELRRTFDVVARFPHPHMERASYWMAGNAERFNEPPTREPEAITVLAGLGAHQ